MRFFVLFFIVPFFVYAQKGLSKQMSNYSISQIMVNQNKAVIHGSSVFEESTIGTDMIITFSDGEQCSIKVIKVSGENALCDITLCERKKEIKPGLKVEKSIFPVIETDLGSKSDFTIQDQNAKTFPEKKSEENLEKMSYQAYKPFLIDFSMLVEKGEVGSILEIWNASRTVDLSYKGNNYLSTKMLGTFFQFTAFGGVSSNTNLGLKITYSNDFREQTTYGSASSSNGISESKKSQGMEDPIIFFKIRAIEQNEIKPINLDLGVFLALKTMDAISATKDNNGNLGSGGNSMKLEALIMKKSSTGQVGFTISQEVLEKRTKKNAANSKKSFFEGGANTVLELGGLLYVENQSSFGGSLRKTTRSALDATSEDNSSKATLGGYSTLDFDLMYKLNLARNKAWLMIALENKGSVEANYTFSGETLNVSGSSYSIFKIAFMSIF